MPYKRIGKVVYSKSGGHWHKKQTCQTTESAEGVMGLLRGLEHGTIKRSEDRKAKKKQ